MSISWRYKRLPSAVIAGGIFCAFLLLHPDPATPQGLFWGRDKKTVVLDPGHGGDDSGAAGPAGGVEKVLVLRLARLIETELGTDYRVSLTRTDDYRVAVLRRTEIANNLQADLFISLHAGGGFSPNAGGMSIYTFKPPEGSPGVLPGRPVPSAVDGEPARLWDRLQQKHAVAGRRLAEAVQIRIEQRTDFTSCRAATAPLMVLQGADMPAILIEIGYLTNPVEEKALMDDAVLTDLARAIGEGIADFLKNRAPP